MLTLSIDTTGADCAVMVARDGAPLADLRETLGRGHAERLAPMAGAAMAQAGLAMPALDRIAVAVGPGGFAGIRVGVAFARGLALALDVPAVGVSLFDVWARLAGAAPLLVAAHDARRGETAWRAWRDGEPIGAEAGRDTLEGAAAAIAALGPAPVICGSAAALLAPRLPGARSLPMDAPDMAVLEAIGRAADPAAAPPAPLYVRPPDAKLPGGLDPQAGSAA